jgi:hypothetical protein
MEKIRIRDKHSDPQHCLPQTSSNLSGRQMSYLFSCSRATRRVSRLPLRLRLSLRLPPRRLLVLLLLLRLLPGRTLLLLVLLFAALLLLLLAVVVFVVDHVGVLKLLVLVVVLLALLDLDGRAGEIFGKGVPIIEIIIKTYVNFMYRYARTHCNTKGIYA